MLKFAHKPHVAIGLEGMDPTAAEALNQTAARLRASGAAKWFAPNTNSMLAEVEDANHHDLAEYVERFALLVEHGLGFERNAEWAAHRAGTGFFKAIDWRDRLNRLRRKGWSNLTYREVGELVDAAAKEAFPDKTAEALAQRIAVRNFFAGKVSAAIRHQHGDVDVIPTRVGDLPDATTTESKDYLEYLHEQSMGLVTGINDNVRNDFRRMLIERRAAKASASDLKQALFDKYADLNSDMRRIAVTETAAAALNGTLTSSPMGTRFRWNAWPGACDYCKKMNGRIVKLVPPDSSEAKNDWDNTIYVGKTNSGRSFAPRKIVGRQLIDRDPSEMAGPATPAHPNCRCFLTVEEFPAGQAAISAETGAFAADLHERRRRAALRRTAKRK